MGDYFLGEIRTFPYNRIPKGWRICDGAELSVQQNTALYALIGNQFGGTPPNTFRLPDLRGRTIVSVDGQAQGVLTQVGQASGTETVTLTLNQTPAHTHTVQAASTKATAGSCLNAYYAPPAPPAQLQNPPAAPAVYGPSANLTALNPAAVTTAGGGQAHENRQPFLALVYAIATAGIWPPRD